MQVRGEGHELHHSAEQVRDVVHFADRLEPEPVVDGLALHHTEPEQLPHLPKSGPKSRLHEVNQAERRLHLAAIEGSFEEELPRHQQ